MVAHMSEKPTDKSIERKRKFVAKYCEKSGTTTHPDQEVTEAVVLGLAKNQDDLGRPLCPCRFYPDKKAEVKHRTWICACDDMQIYKYCHCLLSMYTIRKLPPERLCEYHGRSSGQGLQYPYILLHWS